MIVSCVNCNKKFEINSDLIPNNGRLLQCSICNHQWFFKKKIIFENNSQNEKDIINDKGAKSDSFLNPIKKENFEDQNIKDFSPDKYENTDIETPKKIIKKEKKGINFLKVTLVFVLSFVALIILVDTFKFQIAKIFPNIEFVLYNLYESIKDIFLFFKDLI